MKDGKGSKFAAKCVRKRLLSSMCRFFTYKEFLFQTWVFLNWKGTKKSEEKVLQKKRFCSSKNHLFENCRWASQPHCHSPPSLIYWSSIILSMGAFFLIRRLQSWFLFYWCSFSFGKSIKAHERPSSSVESCYGFLADNLLPKNKNFLLEVQLKNWVFIKKKHFLQHVPPRKCRELFF